MCGGIRRVLESDAWEEAACATQRPRYNPGHIERSQPPPCSLVPTFQVTGDLSTAGIGKWEGLLLFSQLPEAPHRPVHPLWSGLTSFPGDRYYCTSPGLCPSTQCRGCRAPDQDCSQPCPLCAASRMGCTAVSWAHFPRTRSPGNASPESLWLGHWE